MTPPLQLFGSSPADLREMAFQWWFAPLSGLLFDASPTLKRTSMAVTLDGDRVVGRVFPAHSDAADEGWWRQVETASRRRFAAPHDALDHDPGFDRAFRGWCPPAGWTVVARAAREPRREGFGVELEVMGSPRLPDPPPVLDTPDHSDVLELLDGLEALDRMDLLLARSAAIVAAANRQEEYGAQVTALRSMLQRW